MTAEATVRSESDRQGNHGTGLWPVGMTGGRRIRIVPIESLSVGDSPRSAGEDANHTRLLAGIQQKLPPIVVQLKSLIAMSEAVVRNKRSNMRQFRLIGAQKLLSRRHIEE